MIIKSRVELVELMKHLNLPLVAAELGVAEGIWATELLSLGLDKLYLIDIWEQYSNIPGCASIEQAWHDKNFEEVKERFKDKPQAILMKGLTAEKAKEIPDNSLGMVYVDADHSFNGVMADLTTYWPKLVNGGIVAVHDYCNDGYGVGKAVQEFTKDKDTTVIVLQEGPDMSNWGAYFIKKENGI